MRGKLSCSAVPTAGAPASRTARNIPTNEPTFEYRFHHRVHHLWHRFHTLRYRYRRPGTVHRRPECVSFKKSCGSDQAGPRLTHGGPRLTHGGPELLTVALNNTGWPNFRYCNRFTNLSSGQTSLTHTNRCQFVKFSFGGPSRRVGISENADRPEWLISAGMALRGTFGTWLGLVVAGRLSPIGRGRSGKTFREDGAGHLGTALALLGYLPKTASAPFSPSNPAPPIWSTTAHAPKYRFARAF